MYLIPTLLLYSLNINALTTGLFKKFNYTSTLLDKQSEKLTSSLINRNFNIADIRDINEVVLDQEFLNIINFFTPARYVHLAATDKCSLFDLLSTPLAKDSQGEVKNIIFWYQNKKNETKKAILRKDIFLTQIAYKQCPKIPNFKKQFEPQNLANYLKTQKIKIPKSKPQCLSDIENFQKNPKAIYLCNIVESLRKLPKKMIALRNMSKAKNRKYMSLNKEVKYAETLSLILKGEARKRTTEYCLNLNRKEKYCHESMEENYWKKMVSLQIYTQSIKNYCPPPYKSKTALENCINELNRNPYECHFVDSSSSLQPQPSCDLISKALNYSRLYSEYTDCPGNIGNEAVTQSSRIINHLDNKYNENSKDCSLNATAPLAKFDKLFLDNNLWKVNMCYQDKIKKQKVCYPIVLGDISDQELSLSHVVGKVLNRLKGFNNKQNKCRVIKKSEYKPALLEFKTGCYIIKSPKECSAVSCDFEIIIDELKFTNFTVDSDLNIDLFPNNFANENKSMLKLFERYFKKKKKLIRNISGLKRIYTKHKNSIFIGMACAESLLPSYFKTQNLNQCSFLPFIADGVIESKGRYSLVIRTGIDSIHAPRIVPWSNVFSAISHYQKLHPLNLWSFYAIY